MSPNFDSENRRMTRSKESLMATQRHLDALMKQADDAYVQAARAQGVSECTMDILYALRTQGDGLTQKQICDVSFTSKQTVNSAIHKLAERGIVALEPGGGRTTLVSLTPQGKELACRAVDPVVDAECAALAQLSEEETALVVSAFERYVDALARELEKTGGRQQFGSDEQEKLP